MGAADQISAEKYFRLVRQDNVAILQLQSADNTNKLSVACQMALLHAVDELESEAERGRLRALIIAGNEKFFSVGADLNEVRRLSAAQAFEFARAGQAFTMAVDRVTVPAVAAFRVYCMGAAMDLSLACDYLIAAPNAVFGHRGASLGVLTGLGGTQRLPRLIGKARALQMFLLAEMVAADEALKIGLVNAIADDPIQEAFARLSLPHLL